MSSLSNFFDVQSEHDFKVIEMVEHMNFLKTLTVGEYTLYKKWDEINFNYTGEVSNLRIVKNKLWKPTNLFDEKLTIYEIENIKPKIVLIESDNLHDWGIVRIFCHTMSHDQNIGRNLKFLVIDENTNTYIGCLAIASDVIAIKGRDEYIGWSMEEKITNKKINNTSIGSCIMPTQPFGYNFLGGKLMATLITSKLVRDCWENKYIDKLVGFSTTSLYGSYSMYNGIPYWKHTGSSAGKITLKPDNRVYEYWLDYIKTKHSDAYAKAYEANNSAGVATGVKQKIINMILKEVGLSSSQFQHGFERGVYFAPIYNNSREFLQGKIGKSELVLNDKYKSDTDGMISWWKNKAIKRYTKLYQENRLNNDTLFYDDLIGMSWNETKQKYINQVGR